MNPLSPELRRLIARAKTAPPWPVPPVPAGFAARVLAGCDNPGAADLLQTWSRAVWASAWAAVGIIGLGLVLLRSERQMHSAYDLSPAYQVVSTELVP